MSKWFGWLNGKPYDYEYHKIDTDKYLFKLDGKILGQMGKNWDKKSWYAIIEGHLHPDVPRLLDGFTSRHKAIDYILKTNELTKEQYNR